MEDWRREFNRCRELAALAERTGDIDGAVNALRRAAELSRVDEPDEPDLDRSRACGEVCGQLGELLWQERLPEAVQAFQQAADAFGRTEDAESSVACARKVVEGVRLLRYRPGQRLDLLIAQFDRELRTLAEQPDSVQAVACLEFKVGTVLQRRDRFEAAAERYLRSLALYEHVEDSGLAQAACHHRLGDLYNRELQDRSEAAKHYRAAIALYADFEPASEGEQMNRVLCEWHLRDLP